MMREHSVAASRGVAPGRVDWPPTSRMSAPWLTAWRAACRAVLTLSTCSAASAQPSAERAARVLVGHSSCLCAPWQTPWTLHPRPWCPCT